METKEVLEQIGLSDGEIKVYLALLKLGSCPVSDIKEETNLHRTTIYDFVEKLLNKGLINYVVKGNVKFFKATHPNKLLDFIQEREENIKEVLPNLIRLAEFKKEDIKVEVHKGVEGFKTFLNDVLRVNKEFLAFGVDEAIFKERFPILMEQYFKKEAKTNVTERLLTSEKTKFTYDKKTTHYRQIPAEFFNPTPTAIYGDRVMIIIWEPLTIIKIQNSELADSYRKHFEMLWKIAKEFK